MMPKTKSRRATTAMPDLADYMTPQDAAIKLGFHVNSIHRMVREGKLESIRMGKHSLLVSRKSVAKYLEATDGMEKRDPRRNVSPTKGAA